MNEDEIRAEERERIAAALLRDHDMPPHKDHHRYYYRMGWWDAVHHAAHIIRDGGPL